jgi:hypothetical protein
LCPRGFLVAPELSSQVLRCLTDPTDLTGMMNRVAIGSGSVKFLIDNTQMEIANWACETSCFHNNPMPDLTEGLGLQNAPWKRQTKSPLSWHRPASRAVYRASVGALLRP